MSNQILTSQVLGMIQVPVEGTEGNGYSVEQATIVDTE